jgi:hypothetical protein
MEKNPPFETLPRVRIAGGAGFIGIEEAKTNP